MGPCGRRPARIQMKGSFSMPEKPKNPLAITVNGRPHTLKFLLPEQIAMIDEALAALGSFGEVRLIVEKKRLRFVVTQRSHDALKWQPGSLADEGEG